MLTAVDPESFRGWTCSPIRQRTLILQNRLRKAAGEGGLIICECVLAEIRPAFASAGQLDEFVADWELRFVSSSRESALLAGEIFAAHVQRIRRKGGIIADFLIGAHARSADDSFELVIIVPTRAPRSKVAVFGKPLSTQYAPKDRAPWPGRPDTYRVRVDLGDIRYTTLDKVRTAVRSGGGSWIGQLVVAVRTVDESLL
jgi:predicted nucleic acid-binding protein